MHAIKATMLLAGLMIAVAQPSVDVSAQGKGGGKANAGGNAREPQNKGKAKGPEKDRGTPAAKNQENAALRRSEKETGKGPGKNSAVPERRQAKSSRARFERSVSYSSMPASVKKYASSRRPGDVIAAAAVAHAFARGHGDDVRIEREGDRVRLLNRSGEPLLFIDDRSAQDLGRWRVGVLDDEVKDGAPSFCRSGAGHPVWGREWCIDKGFGLGDYGDFRWGRTTDVGDIVYRRGSLGDLVVGSALESLLGTTAFNRLALHAVTLGLLDPLVGRFIGEPTGQQYLVVNSGNDPVAELYDTNRDSRWDDLLVALRPW